jgi:Na+-transporting NADH:ubiquinone oxidoreductase subunit NqrD
MWKYINKTLPTSVKIVLLIIIIADLLFIIFDYLPKLFRLISS